MPILLYEYMQMSIPPVNVSTTTSAQGASMDTGAPGTTSSSAAKKGDSIQSAKSDKASSSWSYMKIVVVSLCAIVACAIAGWFMTVFFRDADRAEAFQTQRDYYKSRLYKN